MNGFNLLFTIINLLVIPLHISNILVAREIGESNTGNFMFLGLNAVAAAICAAGI